MKTKVYWLTLLASAAIVLQTQAHGFGGGGAHFGGASFGGTHFSGGHVASAPVYRAAPARSLAPNYPTYNRSAVVNRSAQNYAGVTQFHPARVVNPNIGSSVAARQSTRENINRGNDGAQVSNRGNHTVTNTQHIRNGVGQARNRNDDLRPDWRTHVYAQHSANWHHDWDRSRDHWWNGHHCRFVNGSWVIFDVGFDPWWSWPCPGYEYGYPCDDVYDDY